MRRKYLSPKFFFKRFNIKNDLLTSSSEDLGDDLWDDGDDLFDDEPETPDDLRVELTKTLMLMTKF